MSDEFPSMEFLEAMLKGPSPERVAETHRRHQAFLAAHPPLQPNPVPVHISIDLGRRELHYRDFRGKLVAVESGRAWLSPREWEEQLAEEQRAHEAAIEYCERRKIDVEAVMAEENREREESRRRFDELARARKIADEEAP